MVHPGKVTVEWSRYWLKNEDGALTTTSCDSANQITDVKDASGGSTFTFDAIGNEQIVKHPDGTITTNVWDYENHTTGVQLPSGARVTTAYDADGMRVSKES